ncbi:inorganic phosphate transporter [Arthrobacter pigmenti]
MELFLLVVVVGFAGTFAFINGFHDASNSVTTAVRTRALTPTIAVLLAAIFNLTGALLGTTLALLISDEWIVLPDGTEGLGILVAALVSACLWGLFTWWRGYPSSSTHALLGGLVGAGFASTLMGGHTVVGADLWLQVGLPLLLSPVLAFGLAYLLVFPITWLARYSQPGKINRRFRMTQSVSAAAFALGHGLQDGQRSMAVILLALIASGWATGTAIPLWVQLFAGTALAIGTLFGGWRIAHTLGRRLVRIDPLRGSVAQGLGAVMLFVGAIGLHMPLSSTHTVSSAIVGAGANQRFDSVNVVLVLKVIGIWAVTAVATGLLGGVFYLALNPVL